MQIKFNVLKLFLLNASISEPLKFNLLFFTNLNGSLISFENEF